MWSPALICKVKLFFNSHRFSNSLTDLIMLISLMQEVCMKFTLSKMT